MLVLVTFFLRPTVKAIFFTTKILRGKITKWGKTRVCPFTESKKEKSKLARTKLGALPRLLRKSLLPGNFQETGCRNWTEA